MAERLHIGLMTLKSGPHEIYRGFMGTIGSHMVQRVCACEFSCKRVCEFGGGRREGSWEEGRGGEVG